jgi:hypothetical protein
VSIQAEQRVRNPAQLEDLIEDTKDRIADAVLIVDQAEEAMRTARRAFDHEFARAMVSSSFAEVTLRKAEATMVAMPEKEEADQAEEAYHHAQREAASLEKELFAWQSILNSVKAMWNAPGGRG